MKRQKIQKIIKDGAYNTPKYCYVAEHYLYEIAIKRIERKYLGTTAAKSDQGVYNPHGWKTITTSLRPQW